MAVTTRFPGTSLPSGWSFSSALTGNGEAVAVSGGYATITCPSNVTHDSVYAIGTAEESVGIAHAVAAHGGDIDFAVEFCTDVSDRHGQGVNLLAYGPAATDIARVTYYHGTGTSSSPSLYGYARQSGSDTTLVVTPDFETFGSGLAAWLRLIYTASSGTWVSLCSADGVTWISTMSDVRALTATIIKIGVTSTAGFATVPVRIGQVVDLLAGGGVTDLRDPAARLSRVTVAQIVGTEGGLPAGFADASAGTSTLTMTGSALRLTHDTGQDNTPVTGGKFRAALLWTGARYLRCGVTFRLSNPVTNGACYLTPSLGYDGAAAPWDQHVRTGGHGLEIWSASTARRPIRIDNAEDRTITVSSFPTGLDETPYCRLADLTTGNSTASNVIHVRIEYDSTTGRFRIREWVDGNAEPGTWNLFDGQDRIENVDPMAFYLSLSHNGNPGAGSCVMDITDLEFYRLTESVGHWGIPCAA